MLKGYEAEAKGKRSFCFVVVEFELILSHPCSYVIYACFEFFGKIVSFCVRCRLFDLCAIYNKLVILRMARKDIRERCSEQNEENRPKNKLC